MSTFNLYTIGTNCDRECIHFTNKSKICKLNVIMHSLTNNIKYMYKHFGFTKEKKLYIKL